MPLRGKKPEAKEKRLKMFLYGPTNVGKTVAISQFPKSYIIDTERGTEENSKSINNSGSQVFQTNSFDDVKAEVKTLLTEKHDFRTLTIEPLTMIAQSVQEKWSLIFGKYAKSQKESDLQDFGPRYWGRVKADYKGLFRLISTIDMNVIMTAHQKDLYGKSMEKLGVGYDSMKEDEYFFDYIFRLENRAGKRFAITCKQRGEPWEEKFPPEFEWSYENFRKFYGSDILERAAVPVPLASLEQIFKAKSLLEIVKISEEEVHGWFTKASVESWEEFTGEQIEKIIKFLDGKINVVMKKSA